MKAGYDVLAIGAPICDYVLQVSDSFLEAIPGLKNGMQMIDLETIRHLINASGGLPLPVAGGSGANTAKGLARLGHRIALLGKVGQDTEGSCSLASLQRHGVIPLINQTDIPTTQVLCLVEPNGSRTFRAFIGASKELTVDDLKPELFEGVRLVHIEGYTILYDGVLEKAMELAKRVGAKVSYDMGSHELVSLYRSRILNNLRECVDLLFCNRDELAALLQLAPDRGCAELVKLCDTVVILMGKNGCLVGRGVEQHFWPAYAANTVDTTGAGDLFASGFLHGYLQELPLKTCAHYGAILGSAVTEVVGAEIPEETWDSLKLKF